jgi:hypothetical protein
MQQRQRLIMKFFISEKPLGIMREGADADRSVCRCEEMEVANVALHHFFRPRAITAFVVSQNSADGVAQAHQ